jgi:tetratricopeptide (TPR) repeat protein
MSVLLRTVLFSALLLLAAIGSAQSWSQRYEDGLAAMGKGEWEVARELFRQAITYRPNDSEKPTQLPSLEGGPILWRGGALYSPNFFSAYASYRLAMAESADAKRRALGIVAAELEVLLDRGQGSREAFALLDRTLAALEDEPARTQLGERVRKELGRGVPLWSVDGTPLSAEERKSVEDYFASVSKAPIEALKAPTPPVDAPTAGRVPPVANKVALIIGNAEGSDLPFALADAKAVREALVVHAGYAESSAVLLSNANADTMRDAAANLAQNLTPGAIVAVFFAGKAQSQEGRDVLLGADGSAIGKYDLLRHFVEKGAQVFAFFEVNRPMLAGHYFGGELPAEGRIAQVQATLPGESIGAANRSGRRLGFFALAMSEVLAEIHADRIPIGDFGWKLYEKIRTLPERTGANRQTPTLPTLTNLPPSSGF